MLKLFTMSGFEKIFRILSTREEIEKVLGNVSSSGGIGAKEVLTGSPTEVFERVT